MTDKEKYEEFVNIVCEMLGFNKPIDILKLCQITSDFIGHYEMKIKELEKENEQLKQQITEAKENGVVWHDLRKNPDDLPKRYKHANRSPLVITNKGIGHYNFIKKTWYIYNAECNCSFFDTVIAWCEIPKFEVEE